MKKRSKLSVVIAGMIALQSAVGMLGVPAASADPLPSVFAPAEIPLSAPDIPNPLRGYVQDGFVPGNITTDYQRFNWSVLESDMGVYTLEPIEQLLQKAANKGWKAGIRIRASEISGVSVPQYLIPMLEKGWYYDMDNNGSKESFIPDWNDPDFIERGRLLLKAIGDRFDGDPRLAWVDIGMYGRYGEWHITPYGENLDKGAKKATNETKRAFIDMHIDAFTATRLVMMSADDYASKYAYWRSPEIGLRRDSLGHIHFEQIDLNMMENVWRNAPVITEPINRERINPLLIPDQIKLFHGTNINNINFNNMENYNEGQQQALYLAGKLTGYRYVLKQLECPSQWTAGQNVPVTAEWFNRGVAPTYEPWDVTYQLRSGSGDVVWQAVSKLNLMNLLPEDNATSVSDQLAVPANLPNGDYSLVMVVKDPAGYSAPLALAVEGRNADGSYTVGTVQLTGGGAGGGAGAPSAVISGIPGTLAAHQFLNASAASSYDADGFISDYQWTVTHAVYGSLQVKGASLKKALLYEGTNTIELTVTDNAGSQNSTQATVVVTPYTVLAPVEPVDHSLEPKPDPEPNPNPTVIELIEDFESGVEEWTHGEDKGTVTIATYGDVPQGLNGQSARLSFDATGTYQYAIKGGLDGSKWVADGRDAIRFWMKGSLNNPEVGGDKFSLQLREFNDQGERWTYNLGEHLRNPNWHQVVVPLNTSAWTFTSGGVTNNDGKMSMNDIEQLRFYVKGSSSKPIEVFVDQIETVNFGIMYPDALRSIKVGAAELANFSPDTTDYHVLLPEGTTTLPTVTGQTYHPGSSITVTQAAYFPGTVTLAVYKPDGSPGKVYKVTMSAPYYKLAKPVFTDWSGNPIEGLAPGAQVKGSITVTQIIYSNKPAVVIAALYEGNGAMHDFVVAEKQMTLGESMTFHAGLTVPQQGDNFTIKVMVWDGIQTMQPMSVTYEFPYPFQSDLVQLVEDAEDGFSSWNKQSGGTAPSAEESGDTPDGTGHSMKLVFPKHNNFAYLFKGVNGALWNEKGAKAIRLWVKGSSSLNLSANQAQLQLRESSVTGERWNHDISADLNKDGWQQLTIPLVQSEWVQDKDGSPKDGVFSLEKAADLRFYYNKVNQPITFLVDQIEIITD